MSLADFSPATFEGPVSILWHSNEEKIQTQCHRAAEDHLVLLKLNLIEGNNFNEVLDLHELAWGSNDDSTE